MALRTNIADDFDHGALGETVAWLALTVGETAPWLALTLLMVQGLVAVAMLALAIRWLWRARPWTLGEFKVAIDGVTFTTADGPQERSWSEVAGVHPKGRRGIRLELREGHDHVVHVPAEDRNHLVAMMGTLIDRHTQDAGDGPAQRTDGNPKLSD